MVRFHSLCVQYLTIVKNGLCWINDVLTDGFTTFNCYLLSSTIKGFYISPGEKELHKLDTMSYGFRVECYKYTGWKYH